MDLVLIATHESCIATRIGSHLEAQGYLVDYAKDGEMALRLVSQAPYAALVLYHQEGSDGVSVCGALRRSSAAIPIMTLGRGDSDAEAIAALDAGADDFVAPPYANEIVHARLHALLRRSRGEFQDGTLRVGELIMELGTRRVIREALEVRLSPTRFKLLHILMREAPRIVTREEMENALWGDHPPRSDALRSHLYSLRQAIDAPFATSMLRTVPHAGYRLLAG
ncbi:response regulator transcription factor [Lysobacter sp. FW306-1B-D06B]|uniref:response regulator transcription factor n=1 Tax=Lysobacter sp. FW306-1B-D06B TaxID=3140250 RepID=UPI0031407C3C